LRYTLENGKIVNISDKDIEKKMKLYNLTKEGAIQLWLEDNDYLVNEELEALDAKSKKVKINHGARADKPRKKSDKPRTVKVSDAKKELFSKLSYYLNEFCEENDANCTILKENKLIELQFGGETFKIDLIQVRKKK
jgi:leucyl aminopeptidase (aminopeptidase T)